ncbi:hypothetical protein EZV62_004896 [Acer yangbiense]|uniref:Uncharacterized protein n=1 Tax=Acer yangbiense TaxID=1000413 RepID=A0A5C7IL81_9ROSI|nr:hypothetical protein EZV62_004896 [Acer yangbiense]
MNSDELYFLLIGLNYMDTKELLGCAAQKVTDMIKGESLEKIRMMIQDDKCAIGFELGWKMEKSSWSILRSLSGKYDVAHTFRPSMPIEIVDDEDVALLLRRENVDPLVCISIEEIGNECPERNHKPPESSANPHHETREYEFHHTQKSNIQVTDIDEFQTSDVPNMGANLDDIVEGFTPTANIDTTSPRLIPDHDETEPQFNPIPNQFPSRYDEQFAHVQRLVPPPCSFYSIHSGEVAPRPVTIRIEV